MSQLNVGKRFGEQILSELRDMQAQMQPPTNATNSAQTEESPGQSFMDHLMSGVNEVNSMHLKADDMAVDLATGKNQNIHETMLAASQAELGFNFMVQIRNKVLEAYQEVMRMQI